MHRHQGLDAILFRAEALFRVEASIVFYSDAPRSDEEPVTGS